MIRNTLNLPALNALLDMATRPQQYESRSQIAAAAEMHESSLSLIASGKRGQKQGVTEETLVAIAAALSVSTEAITVRTDDVLSDRLDRLGMDIRVVDQMAKRLKAEHAQLVKQAERAARPTE